MQTIIENTQVTINTDQLHQFSDGVSQFVGVPNETKTAFIPFYLIGGHYGSGGVFQTETLMPIMDDEIDELWVDTRSLSEIQEEFAIHQAEAPTAVTNVEIFQHVVKTALN